MGSRLQQVLRSFCFNTVWKYAVFWRLKHRSRMILTWEDACYDNGQYPDKKLLNETTGSLSGVPYSQDPLGVVVAKMSYEVYPLGEGIVGQVAISGKHSWIFSDQYVADSSSSSESCGGWQAQFSAGIKTIAVVSVIPHGIVQVGSLHKIAEDLKLVNQIRKVIFDLQDSLPSCIPSSMKSITESSCLSDTFSRTSDLDCHDCLARLKGSSHEDKFFSQLGDSANHTHFFPSTRAIANENLKIKMHERALYSVPANESSHSSSCRNFVTRQLQQEEMEPHKNTKYGREANALRDLGKRPAIMILPPIENVRAGQSSLYAATRPTDNSQMVAYNPLLEYTDLSIIPDQVDLHVPEFQTLQLHQAFEKFELPIKSGHIETQVSPFSYCAGYELFEALGPSFWRKNDPAWLTDKTGCHMAIDTSEGIGTSCLLTENIDAHLLDAVVAKARHKGDETESEKSCRDTGESHLTSSISSAGYSYDREMSRSLKSVACSVESFNGFPSTSSSRDSEHLNKSQEAVKANKKRARAGESCRPRPRDRQLIQDRIKELRELIPNGSKCSIDSLLEQTIKHVLFLQSITKHADNLSKCSASKLLNKDTSMRRFSCKDQGSTWAVEVGSNQKVCPIKVENINMNGQMLVEMLCNECSQFLEIAETIRTLGLNILKGVSEACGNKTWMCFLVEEQNNRSMHRMDILWSLMQLLQPKISH